MTRSFDIFVDVRLNKRLSGDAGSLRRYGANHDVILMRSILFVKKFFWSISNTSHWHRNGRDGVSNHQPHHCLFISLFRRRSKKISKFRDTGLCEGHSPFTGEFTAQSNAENVSIWWRHRDNQFFNFLIPNNGGIRSNNLTLWSDIHVILINSYFTYTYGVTYHILPLAPCIIDGLRQLRQPRIWCCHYLPPGSLLTLGASESLPYSHISFNLI